jgi:hypothetical protein
MKLIFCPLCEDVRKLHKEETKCRCGKSSGKYLEDGLHAVIAGEAIPLGFSNPSFAEVLRNRPREGMGQDFVAFVMPKYAKRIIKM